MVPAIFTTPIELTRHDMADTESAEWLFASNELPHNKDLLPTIANGFLGTRIFSSCIYAAGIFNGDHLNSHRAAIPSTVPFDITLQGVPGKLEKSYTINAKLGFFVQTITYNDVEIQVEQKIYAHKHYRNLIITDLKAKTNLSQGCTLVLQSFAGMKTKDIDFKHEKEQGTTL